jgi:hypothetical protein
MGGYAADEALFDEDVEVIVEVEKGINHPPPLDQQRHILMSY